MTRKNIKIKHKQWFVLLLASSFILCLLWKVINPFVGLFGFRPPLTIFKLMYAPYIQLVKSHKLKPNNDGTIYTPYGTISPDNRIFADRKPDGRLFIIFPTWYGRGDDFNGYLWCSSSLQTSDGYDYTGRVGDDAFHLYVIANRGMLQVQHVEGFWWWVSRRAD